VSALGPVRLSRAYYSCRHCHKGPCPWDQTLRLTTGDLTPAAEELLSLAGSLARFADAAGKVLPRLAGVRLAESTAERTPEGAGQRLAPRRAAGETSGRRRDWPWSKDARGRTCAYVWVDATGVGMQGPRATAAEGRRAYVGLIYCPGEEGEPARQRVLAGLSDLPDLAAQLRRQGRRWAWTGPTRGWR
jgi:hypothetical protein